MSAETTLVRVVAALGRAGIQSMLTGSRAAAIHGYPRATQDIDLVIEATEAQVRALAVSLADEDVFFDLERAVDACARGSMTNILDNATGWKVDLIQPDLDVAHIERWLDELGVRQQWQDACRLVGRALD